MVSNDSSDSNDISFKEESRCPNRAFRIYVAVSF